MQPAQSSVEIDPVCGMTIDPTTSSRRRTHGGRLYHFCSARCQTKFAEQPETFLSLHGGTSSNSAAGTIYTCPMHPQSGSLGPAVARFAAWRWSP
jgi:Cu+-exporting ATPase